MRQVFDSRGFGATVRCVAFVAAVCVGAAALPSTAASLPPSDFFKKAEFSELVMSPSGKYISALVLGGDGRKRLAVLDVADLSKSRIVASSKTADVVDARWVNDERLVLWIYDSKDSLVNNRHAAMLAVNASGNDSPRVLVRQLWRINTIGTNIADRSLTPNHRLRALLRNGSNDVIVEEYVFDELGDVDHTNLKRLDTVNGQSLTISLGAPPGARHWALDAAGNPRVVGAIQQSKELLYWKPTPDSEWIKVQETERASGAGPANPLYVDAGNRLFASARADAKDDNASLVSVDLSSSIDKAQVLLSAPGYDLRPSIERNGRGDVLGVHYLTDARGSLWFDAGMKAIQERVNALLPGTINRLGCGTCEHRDKVLVTSSSDRQPPAYWLFDTKAGTLASIGSSRPWVKPTTMAQRDMIRIEARDGLSLPVHITRPNGAKGPQPMVVLVHGGPYVRGGQWAWEPESQFLASRGYLVVEPEFRGSTGFGFKHFRAGWKQWGLKMQDDLADAAQWAVKQGFADPKRICIAGASYGGYATLMGLIRNPELFRCGFEWVGVTDIDLMYSASWSDTSEDSIKYSMPFLIGDRVKDAAQLAATSPIRLADKVTQPLLMAYGALDRRVPMEHGTQFRDAVRKTNKQVEWVVYPDEGHGWAAPETDIDFWTRVEQFLDKNLKNAP